MILLLIQISGTSNLLRNVVVWYRLLFLEGKTLNSGDSKLVDVYDESRRG